MQLSKKLKSFSELFCAFFKSTLYFERFLKNDDPHSLSIPESTNCESGGQTNVSKVKFQKILQQATWQLVPKTIEISRPAPLPYLLITVKAIE